MPISPKTLDTTLSGTDKARFLGKIWTFTSGNDYAKGNISFTKGMTLMSTSLTYTVCVGVTGAVESPINLNGNTLKLTHDMQLGDLVRVFGPGFIDCIRILSRGTLQINGYGNIVFVFSLAPDGEIAGKDSIISLFTPLMLGTPMQALGLTGLRIISPASAGFITRSTSNYFAGDLTFFLDEGVTFELNGGIFTSGNAGLTFLGQGATVVRKVGPAPFDHLKDTSFYKIGTGVTYITEDAIKLGGKNTRIILDNAAFISKLPLDFVTLGGGANFEILGNSTFGSENGGTIRLYKNDKIRIFPGATLTIDNELLLKLR